MKKNKKLILLTCVLISIFAFDTSSKEKKEEIVWPLPPEPTRIKYINKIRDFEDVRKKSFLDKLGDILFGEKRHIIFKKPYGIAVDKEGVIYVTDTGWGKLIVINRNAKKDRVKMWGRGGKGILSKPIGVGVDDKRGHIYVSDAIQRRVVVFNKNGDFVDAIGGKEIFEKPVGLAVDVNNNRLYVIDIKKHHIVYFDLSTHKKLGVFGKRGPAGPDTFNFPTNIHVDKDGNIYIMDTFNFKVHIYDKNFNLIKMFGDNCDVIGCIPRGKGISTDSEGHIYVIDAAFSAVLIFDREGRFLLPFGGFGHQEGKLWLPAGIWISPDDRIYVVDQYNFRVNIYQYVKHKK